VRSGIHVAVRCEVIVELRHDGDAAVVARWFEERGLDVLPLVVGLLVAGEEDTVRETFDADPGGRLPVPQALRDHVRSTARVSPKRLQG
jgi:hypothetical protein